MSRRDYERLAAAFNNAYRQTNGTDLDRTRLRHFGVTEALLQVMAELRADNPRFDAERFKRAAQQSVIREEVK